MVINISEAIAHLNQGGILVYPTDTVYGIGCLPQYAEKILTIKPRESGFIIITDDISRHLDWIDEPFNPPKTTKPTTWVLKASKKVPEILMNDGHIAIRQVSHTPTVLLLNQLDQPLISTSANYPKQPTPTTIEELEAIFDLPILEGETGNQPPSTIIHYKTKKVIRP